MSNDFCQARDEHALISFIVPVIKRALNPQGANSKRVRACVRVSLSLISGARARARNNKNGARQPDRTQRKESERDDNQRGPRQLNKFQVCSCLHARQSDSTPSRLKKVARLSCGNFTLSAGAPSWSPCAIAAPSSPLVSIEGALNTKLQPQQQQQQARLIKYLQQSARARAFDITKSLDNNKD